MDSYEKKYKESLARAREIHFSKDEMEYIFPELKESEDENIRKAILSELDYLQNKEGWSDFGDYQIEDVIAWLEKQGEQKQETNYPKFDFDDILAIQCCMEAAEKVTEGKELYEKLKSLHSRLLDAYWIEKKSGRPQGKTALEAISEENVDNANKVESKDYNSIDPHFGKPADKVESKFHEGDWIIHHGTENIYQVVAIIDNQYQLKYGDNYTVQKCADVDRCARLWDVAKDAKDGDVLNSPSNRLIWIYKDNEHYHACVNMNYVTDNVATDDLLSIPNDVCPATKDEQAILLARMKDAGYEWDAKLKQVKKIKNEIEIPYGAKDSELMEASYNIPKGFHAEIDGDKVVIKKGEKPTAWSEEDENIKEWIMSDINKLLALNRKSFVIADKEITWLKSLKDRVGCEVNCTTTKECGEEDEVILDEIIDFFENGTVKLQHDLSLYASWLKSLKNRYTWKPSDEQMAALNNAILLNEDHYNGAVLSTLREQLMKLK